MLKGEMTRFSARNAVVLSIGALICLGTLFGFQKPFRQYHGVEYYQFETPPDWQQPGEFVFARMMFPGGANDGYYPRFQGDWRLGLSLWTQDYPRADRHFSMALKRLTRIQVRSVEQPVNLDENEQFDLPWLYAVQVGEWGPTPKQCQELREYLLRGGFFMADDFHGNTERQVFLESMKLVFPDRPVVEIPDGDPILHTVYDLSDRIQVPGQAHVRAGCKNCSDGGRGAHWQGIYDDKGRIMVAITYNSDIGDAWEFADDPTYPENAASSAIRLGVNYVVYSMTH
ncbi:MAG TPA: DUF4159 domain-containing protein [Bryobacteraceae bacterium]|nr:DUF4159 domain-containing protein [Bryobacteraceae bacterium]